VAGGDLNVPERDTGVEGGHDERRSQHVRVQGAEFGALADRTHPAVSSAPVVSSERRALQLPRSPA
jgi:hypothetical protein